MGVQSRRDGGADAKTSLLAIRSCQMVSPNTTLALGLPDPGTAGFPTAGGLPDSHFPLPLPLPPSAAPSPSIPTSSSPFPSAPPPPPTHLEEQPQLLPAAVPQVPLRCQLADQVAHAQREVPGRHLRQVGGAHVAVARGHTAVVGNQRPAEGGGRKGELHS